jgi:hypothetical protein
MDVVVDADGNLIGRIVGDNSVGADGRILGKIVHICPTTKFVTEMHLSMIAAGHAKAYFGGKKNVR